MVNVLPLPVIPSRTWLWSPRFEPFDQLGNRPCLVPFELEVGNEFELVGTEKAWRLDTAGKFWPGRTDNRTTESGAVLGSGVLGAGFWFWVPGFGSGFAVHGFCRSLARVVPGLQPAALPGEPDTRIVHCEPHGRTEKARRLRCLEARMGTEAARVCVHGERHRRRAIADSATTSVVPRGRGPTWSLKATTDITRENFIDS